ncbi:10854_t:CDS:2, partial [Acaulospora colombiana]
LQDLSSSAYHNELSKGKDGFYFHDFSCTTTNAIKNWYDLKKKKSKEEDLKLELYYSSQHFESFIAYLYGLPLQYKRMDNLFVFAYLALKFRVPELTEYCENLLIRMWDRRMWRITLKVSKWLGLHKLRSEILKFLWAKGVEKLFSSRVAKFLKEDDIKDIIKLAEAEKKKIQTLENEEEYEDQDEEESEGEKGVEDDERKSVGKITKVISNEEEDDEGKDTHNYYCYHNRVCREDRGVGDATTSNYENKKIRKGSKRKNDKNVHGSKFIATPGDEHNKNVRGKSSYQRNPVAVYRKEELSRFKRGRGVKRFFPIPEPSYGNKFLKNSGYVKTATPSDDYYGDYEVPYKGSRRVKGNASTSDEISYEILHDRLKHVIPSEDDNDVDSDVPQKRSNSGRWRRNEKVLTNDNEEDSVNAKFIVSTDSSDRHISSNKGKRKVDKILATCEQYNCDDGSPSRKKQKPRYFNDLTTSEDDSEGYYDDETSPSPPPPKKSFRRFGGGDGKNPNSLSNKNVHNIELRRSRINLLDIDPEGKIEKFFVPQSNREKSGKFGKSSIVPLRKGGWNRKSKSIGTPREDEILEECNDVEQSTNSNIVLPSEFHNTVISKFKPSIRTDRSKRKSLDGYGSRSK